MKNIKYYTQGSLFKYMGRLKVDASTFIHHKECHSNINQRNARMATLITDKAYFIE